MPSTPAIVSIARTLARRTGALPFAPPVTHVYNPPRVRMGAAPCVSRALRRGLARDPHARDEPRSFRDGADRRALRRRGLRSRLARDRGQSRAAEGRASEAARHRLRMPARRGERASAVGLGPEPVRGARALLRAFLHLELLPALLHGGIGAEPHSRQAPGRRARAVVPGVRRCPCARRPHARRPARARESDGLPRTVPAPRWATRWRSALRRIRAPRARSPTGGGSRRSSAHWKAPDSGSERRRRPDFGSSAEGSGPLPGRRSTSRHTDEHHSGDDEGDPGHHLAGDPLVTEGGRGEHGEDRVRAGDG